MNLNPKSKIRSALYVIGFVGTPTIGYLYEQGVIPAFWFGLWTVLSAAIFGLAKINVSPDTTDEQ